MSKCRYQIKGGGKKFPHEWSLSYRPLSPYWLLADRIASIIGWKKANRHIICPLLLLNSNKVHIRARELGASRFEIKFQKTKKISMHLGIRKTFMLVLIFFLIFLYLEQRYHNMYKSKISVLSHLIEYWMRKYLFILRHRFPGAQFKLILKLCEPWNNSL